MPQDTKISTRKFEASNPAFLLYAVENKKGFHRFLVPSGFDGHLAGADAKGLVIYDDPARVVAAALPDGAAAETALNRWIETAEQHLAIIRRRRRGLVVIQRAAASRPDAQAAFNQAFPNATFPQEARPLEPADERDLLIGRLAVAAHDKARRLANELEASSIAVEASPSFADTLAGLADLLEAQAETEADTESIDVLMRQVQDLQSSLERSEKTRAGLQSELETASGERDAANAALAALYNSTSWKISAPVRAFKRLLSR